MNQNLIKNKSVIDYEYSILQKHVVEIVVLLIYSSLLTFVMYYHEPWLDEAQAWLIARDATISELFRNVTHYEGHPPLWFLILMPFAKLGMPFEIGLKSINFVIVIISIAIFVLKAPFNRIYRCTVPFTYFFFYQYGALSRPYSLMMLAFILSAMFFKKRNESPYRLTASLILLCSSSAYGIVISFGIVIFWICENVIQLYKHSAVIKAKLYMSWAILLIFNIMIVFTLYPYKDTFALNANKQSWMTNIFYMFFAAPMEALFTNSIYKDLESLSNIYYMFILAGGYLITIVLLFITIKYKKTGLYVIPYTLFSIFSSVVYFSSHHVGIIVMFYVFIIWCCLDENMDSACNNGILNKRIWGNFIKLIISISIIISINWSISSSIYDVRHNYGNGRDISEFITYHNLDKQNIYAAWYPISVEDNGAEIYDYNFLCGIPALAYFNENIFLNFNEKKNDKCYLLHKLNIDGNYIYNLIKENSPEVLLISNRIQYSFGKNINIDDFVLIRTFKANMIWKDSNNEYVDSIYIRKDLLKNYPGL